MNGLTIQPERLSEKTTNINRCTGVTEAVKWKALKRERGRKHTEQAETTGDNWGKGKELV